MRKLFMTAALGASAILMAAPAAGQQSGLVNVDVSNVLNNLTIKDVLSKNNVQANVPVNVQVPIGLAANVCGTTVALLSAAGSGGACQAHSENMTAGTARALANSIVRAAQNQQGQ